MGDNNTVLKLLKERVRDHCADRDWDQFHTPKDIAIGVATEAGELLDLFRFKTNDDVRRLLRDDAFRKSLSDEISDVLYFLLRLADVEGIDISEAFEDKMRDNERKYPIEKAKGVNAKYTEL